MRKSVFVRFLAIACCSALLTLSGCSASEMEEKTGESRTEGQAASVGGTIELKIASQGNEEHPYPIAAQAFADKIQELSGGTITATLYPNAILGGEREIAEGVKLGSIEMAVLTSDGALPNWVPEIQIMTIPYLFETEEEVYYVLDHYLQDVLAPKFEENGIRHLGFCSLGFRHFTNNRREITKASDMEGLTIRVQESSIWFALADSLKFIATPIAFNELYTALQQGTVDGQENPLTSIATSAFDEVQKYMCLDGHTFGAGSIIMNAELYNGMTEEQQGWIDEAVAYTIDYQRKVVEESEAAHLEKIKATGTIVCEDPDIQSFKGATAGLSEREDVKALVPPELVQGVRDALKEFHEKGGSAET